jgi:uncharacterized repeat protein (TIGR03803 family)
MIIHAFSGQLSSGHASDGSYPSGPMVMDAAGNLYGTTQSGGETGFGTVFQLTPPTTSGGSWTETVIYNFKRNHDGQAPLALTFGWEGSLYGVAEKAAENDAGAVFRLTKMSDGTWSEGLIYQFPNGEGYPQTLIGDKSGNLYGTTLQGNNSCNCGTVFELSPPKSGEGWVETTVYTFTGAADGDGADPSGPLVLDGLGNLYGGTEEGGTDTGNSCVSVLNSGCGAIFELSPQSGGSWAETILHSFAETVGQPWGPFGPLVFDASGNLYGTTAFGGSFTNCGGGCGTVFELSPPSAPGGAWTETTLHQFESGPEAKQDGFGPANGVVFGLYGALYGTTGSGGSSGFGTVFSLRP